MTVLTICMDGSITVGQSILSTMADEFEETAPDIGTLPRVGREKVVRVREQMDNDEYDLDERLDAVLERILTDISD